MGNEKEHFGRPAKVRNYGSHFGWMDGWKERKGTGRTGESKGESGFTFVYVTRVLAPFLRLLPATAMMMMMSPVQPGLHLSPRILYILPQAGDTHRVERLRAD